MSKTSNTISEMREFATFPSSAQRYIRRSLDVAAKDPGSVSRWARDDVEAASIRAQFGIYERLDAIRHLMPDASGIVDAEPMISPLVTMAAFDLGQDRLPSFSAFRFLYERILGGGSRPWLPSAFMAAAGMPHIRPDRRGELLKSISEAAATAPGWSAREPEFYPRWVEKVEMAA